MRGAGTHGLHMVLAFLHHLVVVDSGNLGIPLARHISIQVGVLLDQVRPGLGDVQSFALTAATLLAVRHHARPATEEFRRGEALGITDQAGIDSGAVLADSPDRLQIPAGMNLPIQGMHRFQTDGVVLVFQGSEAGLLAADFGLQAGVVDGQRIRAVEQHKLVRQLDQRHRPVAAVSGIGLAVQPLPADGLGPGRQHLLRCVPVFAEPARR